MAVSLKATIGLITTPFTAGIKRMGASIKRMGGQVRGMVSGAIGKFAMLAGAAGMGMLIRKTISLGSELSDLADRTHTTVERFGTLRELSRDAGVEVSVLERALRNVKLRTQAAADGNLSYAKAIKRLGIDMKAFLKLDSAKQFEQVAIAVKNAANKSEAFRDVATLLGERAGPQLKEVLREVAEKGLDPLADALVKTGQIMRGDTARTLDMLEDMFQRFKDQMLIVTGNLLMAFIPANGKAKEAMNDLVDKGVVFLAKAIGLLVLALKNAYDFFILLIEAGGGVVDVFVEWFNAVKEDLAPALIKLAKAVKDLIAAFITKDFLKMNKAMGDLGVAADEVGDAFGGVGAKADAAWAKHGDGVVKAFEKFKGAAKDNIKMFEDLNAEQGKFAFLANLGAQAVKGVGDKAANAAQFVGANNFQAMMLQRHLMGANGALVNVKAKLAAIQLEFVKANAGAQALAGFFGAAAAAAGNLLANEQMRQRNAKRLKQMQAAALAQQQKAIDLTKKGFNALINEKLAIEGLALEWLKLNAPQKVANANAEELNQMIIGAVNHVRPLRERYKEVGERIDEARKKLVDVVHMQKLQNIEVQLNRDHHQQLLDKVFGVRNAQAAILRLQQQIADLEMVANVDPEKVDELKKKLEEARKAQAAFNAEAGHHPLIEPGMFNPDAADFRVFKEQKTLLEKINNNLEGFFVNL